LSCCRQLRGGRVTGAPQSGNTGQGNAGAQRFNVQGREIANRLIRFVARLAAVTFDDKRIAVIANDNFRDLARDRGVDASGMSMREHLANAD
jgi:hypothetical protein